MQSCIELLTEETAVSSCVSGDTVRRPPISSTGGGSAVAPCTGDQERSRTARIETWAWNHGMMDGWNNRLPEDGPPQFDDPALSEAWWATYLEAYQEGRRSALPYDD